MKYFTISETMRTRQRDSTKETGWGYTGESATAPREIFSPPLNMHRCALILQRPTKLLKPTHA